MLESAEKLGQALGSAEKAGATKEIQLAEEGGSLLKSPRAWKYFQSHFSRSVFGGKIYFEGSLWV